MGVLDTLARRLGYTKAAPPARRSGDREIEGIVDDMRHAEVDYAVIENQEAVYARSSWIYTAISFIARSVASVPLSVMERKGEGLEPIINHPFEVLWQRPNPYMTKTEVVTRTLTNHLLTGNAYLYLYAKDDGLAEIWPLRSSRMSPVVDAEKFISGYIYEVNAQKYPYDPIEIVHWPMANPLSEVRGLSPIEVLQYTIKGDLEAQKYNVAFFKNAAVIPTLVAIKGDMQTDDFNTFKAEFKAQFTGAANAHKVGFLRGTEIDVKTLGVSPKDIEFANLRKLSREEIFQLYGVPMGLMSENATEANAKTASDTFREQTIWPLLVGFAEKLTAEVMQPFFGEEYICQFEDIRPTNRDIELKEMQLVGQFGWMTGTEVRKRYFKLAPMELAPPAAPTPAEKPQQALPEKPGEEDQVEGGTTVAPPSKPGEASRQLMLDDLRRWRDKAAREAREIGHVDRALDFDSMVIPAETFSAIARRLARAESVADVKIIFLDARSDVKAAFATKDDAPVDEDRSVHEARIKAAMREYLQGAAQRVAGELRRGAE